MPKQPCKLTRTAVGVSRHSFGAIDRWGRRIGAIIVYTNSEYTPIEMSVGTSYWPHEPGKFFSVMCQQTRAGYAYGAGQNAVDFKTVEERDAHVEKYLKSAKARAAKAWATKGTLDDQVSFSYTPAKA